MRPGNGCPFPTQGRFPKNASPPKIKITAIKTISAYDSKLFDGVPGIASSGNEGF